MSLKNLVGNYEKNQSGLNWEGTFSDYLGLVEKDPKVARLSHARVYDMIMSYGVETEKDGKIIRYKFFDNEIFGSQKAINALVEYFCSGAQGKESRKRILLLMGPAGGGKSSIVILLKKGMEEYTKTNEGALYGIKDCPHHEEPLHLLSGSLRKEVNTQYNINIEGDLCPYCQWRLQHEWNGDFTKAKIERVIFSEMNRTGIGTFSPSDPKSQDISELVGSMDLSKIGEYGAESDPRAWRFDGELNVSNRGIMEFIELLKVDSKFLYTLINLAQEQRIKMPRYPLVYLDEVVISHTNEAEYNSFISDSKNEALKDRMHIIKVPYNLVIDEEAKIYDKLLKQGSNRVHLAPNTTKVAAMFGVLTRLEDVESTKKINLVDKMKVYNNQKLEGWTTHEVRTLQDDHPREGMTGAGPRFLTDAIGKPMAKPNVKCINPITALRGIIEHLDYHPSIDPKTKENYKNHIGRVRNVYHELLQKEVMKAFVIGYEGQARAMVDRYLIEINAWGNKEKIEDPVTQELRQPDEKYMRSIEEQIGVGEPAKSQFREEIIRRVTSLALKNQKFDYNSHDLLKQAVEKQLFHDVKSVAKTVLSATSLDKTNTLDKTQKERLDQVVESLKNNGYCEHCAREVLIYMSRIID